MTKLGQAISGGEMELWAILGAVGTLAALALAGYIFYNDRHRRKKALTAEFISVFSLVNQDVKTGGKELRVFLGEEPVGNLTVCQIRILNSGGCPILGADFENPMKIMFHDSKKIYFFSVKDEAPSSLSPIVYVEKDALTITPLLLNPGDHFTLEAGFDSHNWREGRPGFKFEVMARIAGIPFITLPQATSYAPIDMRARNLQLFGVLLGILLWVGILVSGLLRSAPPIEPTAPG